MSGVGKGTQDIKTEAVVPGQLDDGQTIDFKTAVVQGSSLPALWGIDSMEKLHAVVDTRIGERKLYLGPDISITPGPKTKVLQMYPAESGHLMLPITCYDEKTGTRSKTVFLQQQPSSH